MGLGPQAHSYVQVDMSVRATQQGGHVSDVRQSTPYKMLRPSSQPSTPRPSLVRRHASVQEEVPTSDYFTRRTTPLRDEVPSMNYCAQHARGPIPIPTTGFISRECIPANPPQQPAIRPQASPPSLANDDGLVLLGSAPGDFFIPPDRFKLPPPQNPIATSIRDGLPGAGLQRKEPGFKKYCPEAASVAESMNKKEGFALLSKALKESKSSFVQIPAAQPPTSKVQEDHVKYPHPPTILPPGVTEYHEPWIIERKRLHVEKLNHFRMQAGPKKQEVIAEQYIAEAEQEKAEKEREEFRKPRAAATVEKARQKTREERARRLAVEGRLANLCFGQKPEKVAQGSNAELIQRLRAVDRKHAGLKVAEMLSRRNELGVQAVGYHKKGCDCGLCAQVLAYDGEIAKTVETMSSQHMSLSKAAKDRHTTDINRQEKEDIYRPGRVHTSSGTQDTRHTHKDVGIGATQNVSSSGDGSLALQAYEIQLMILEQQKLYSMKKQQQNGGRASVLPPSPSLKNLPEKQESTVHSGIESSSRTVSVVESQEQRRSPGAITVVGCPSRTNDAETQTDVNRPGYCANCVCSDCKKRKAEKARSELYQYWHQKLEGEEKVKEVSEYAANCVETRRIWENDLRRRQTRFCQQLPDLDYDSEDSPSELGNLASKTTSGTVYQEMKDDPTTHGNTATKKPTLYVNFPPLSYATLSTNEGYAGSIAREGLEQHQPEVMNEKNFPRFHFRGNPHVGIPESCQSPNPAPAKLTAQSQCRSMQPRPTRLLTSKDAGLDEQRQNAAKLPKHSLADPEAAAEKERRDKLTSNFTQTMMGSAMVGEQPERAGLEESSRELCGNDSNACCCFGKCSCEAPHLTCNASRVMVWVAETNEYKKLLAKSKRQWKGHCGSEEEDSLCEQFNFAVNCQNCSKPPSTDNLWTIKYAWSEINEKGQVLAEYAPGARRKANTVQNTEESFCACHEDDRSTIDDTGYQAECDEEDEDIVETEVSKSENEELEWQKVEKCPKNERYVHRDGDNGMVFDRERNMWFKNNVAGGTWSDENFSEEIRNLSVEESAELRRIEERKGKEPESEEGEQLLAGLVFNRNKNIWIKKKSAGGSHSHIEDDPFGGIHERAVDESAELQQIQEKRGQKSQTKDELSGDETNGGELLSESDENYEIVYRYWGDRIV